MTAEAVAPYGLVALFVIKEVYGAFTAGQKLDDRIEKKIQDAAKSDKAAEELRQQLSDQSFEHMATDIKRISDSIAEIMRMLRESVATKQDILRHDARLDALEESNRGHYESFRRVDRDVSAIRERCGSHHQQLRRQASESSTFPREKA